MDDYLRPFQEIRYTALAQLFETTQKGPLGSHLENRNTGRAVFAQCPQTPNSHCGQAEKLIGSAQRMFRGLPGRAVPG